MIHEQNCLCSSYQLPHRIVSFIMFNALGITQSTLSCLTRHCFIGILNTPRVEMKEMACISCHCPSKTLLVGSNFIWLVPCIVDINRFTTLGSHSLQLLQMVPHARIRCFSQNSMDVVDDEYRLSMNIYLIPLESLSSSLEMIPLTAAFCVVARFHEFLWIKVKDLVAFFPWGTFMW